MSDLGEIKDFRESFINDITLEASAEGQFNEEKFIIKCCEYIEQDGGISEPIFVDHNDVATKIHAYCYIPLERSICIFTSNFIHIGEWEKPQARGEVLKIAERAKRFIERTQRESFFASMEPALSNYKAAEDIKNLIENTKSKILKIRIIYITDGLLSERTAGYEIGDSGKIMGIPAFVQPYGIRNFYEMDRSTRGEEDFEIDFDDLCGGLQALETNLDGLKSYLVVMPGLVLHEIYKVHGQKLLEANVRNFLNFTNKKNQGMRNTLMREPEKFFAYNNGLTVTASGMETKEESNSIKILNLKNMQIVNGGQTTCVIYFSPSERGGENIDLNKVFVQMKLTIVEDKENIEDLEILDEELEKVQTFKANIAHFANSQSPVTAADLMSNSPFHIRMEQAGKRIATPLNNEGLSNYWFYERAKGQWNTLKRNDRNEKRFLKKFPKNQIIKKEDLARYENSWRLKPYDVSKGAAKNLNAFYKEIVNEFRDNENRFRDQFFKDLVSKRIICKTIETTISKSDWFESGTYLRPFVTAYSFSLIVEKLAKKDLAINLARIWSEQSISVSFQDQLNITTEYVYSKFMDDSFRNNMTYREWAQKEACWIRLKADDHKLDRFDKAIDLLNKHQIESAEEENEEIGNLSETIENITDLYKVSKEEWLALIEYFQELGYNLNQKEISLPNLMYKMHTTGQVPTDRQLNAVKRIYQKALNDAFIFKK
ncbi:AIPR family protein [Gammaproteobacteria bacterium]|nr:AIPR family protein [Gammaproteobacteria bacterium]MDB4156398.1 AIPR family protein [Gammaproteobacteria bacterium]